MWCLTLSEFFLDTTDEMPDIGVDSNIKLSTSQREAFNVLRLFYMEESGLLTRVRADCRT